MKAIFTFMLLALCQFAFAQKIEFKKLKDIIVEKGDSSLVVPIEFKVVRTKRSADEVKLRVSPSYYVRYFSLRKDTVKIKGKEATVSFYVQFNKKVITNEYSRFKLKFSLANELFEQTIQFTVKPKPKFIHTLQDYLDKDSLLLEKVTKVESNDNVLTVYGYREGNEENVVTRKVILSKGTVFKSWERGFKFDVSVVTIPFKIRPGFGDYRATAQAGLTNIGLNFGVYSWRWDHYRSDASKKSQKVSIGGWIAPSVEELDTKSLRTSGLLANDEKSRQMFLSTGLTLTYTVNSLSFVLVPAGFDMPTSKLGKQWIYRGQYWWGFGIALEPKFLATVLGK